MKYISFALLFLSSCEGRNTAKLNYSKEINRPTEILKIFKTTNYSFGRISTEVYDTIKSTQKNIDIYYFKKHFHRPYYLPNSLTSGHHKDTVITIWGNLKSTGLYDSNWTNTYTYDSLGHVANYAYSSCITCSSFAFNYIITYNSLGQVNTIKNTLGEQDSYVIHYSKTNDIKELNIYSSGELEASIAAIK
ncbi:hypothetical protein [Hymenobacter sp. YC55]|uniref:hypothetical protein n=1 Tax=Hymenobacter sp. YC55 TaxID=3034019 RepID=UPI0023F6E78C|nr:hypothetical protein [Hymenobacter sp. YC55]MDF7810818.1 hypothetical protein [Hymenobacter sp. YC55]